ncbi:hypothetical protein BS47DRAFT_1490636 [Hydnum rufescens UP504]|uniref:Uncharacterized protein n=1 Tax=Hydnum rufescens UP504 TaxID=1448309 RepID=A0A9P6AC28_9AGAM|nr:hypothetical protein BS47DRAFT_1490636 [Hydnum rufescens UP504]
MASDRNLPPPPPRLDPRRREPPCPPHPPLPPRNGMSLEQRADPDPGPGPGPVNRVGIRRVNCDKAIIILGASGAWLSSSRKDKGSDPVALAVFAHVACPGYFNPATTSEGSSPSLPL